jgi:hypothetical protein
VRANTPLVFIFWGQRLSFSTTREKVIIIVETFLFFFLSSSSPLECLTVGSCWTVFTPHEMLMAQKSE